MRKRYKESAMSGNCSRRKFLAEAGVTAALIGLGGCVRSSRRIDEEAASASDADQILFNASIATMNPARPRASAVAIRDGRFIAVDANADILKLKGSRTRTIDLRG